jgi:hypothetical protein
MEAPFGSSCLPYFFGVLSWMTAGKKPINLPISPTVTLAEAQDKLKSHVKGPGVICPCCHQLVRMVEKELSSTMVYVLILMYRHFQTASDWLDMSQYLDNMVALGSEVKGGEWSKLKYWQLIVERPPEKKSVLNPKPTVKTQGMYKLTDKGRDFVLGKLKAPKSLWIYNGHVIEANKKSMSIQECLGKDYKYEDIMAGNLGSFAV